MFGVGSYVWVSPEGKADYSLPWAGRIMSKDKNIVEIVNDNREVKKVPESAILSPLYAGIIESSEDMITLTDLQERTLLRNIHLRYNKDEVYTYIGWILVAVNPYKKLDIYSNKEISHYQNRRIGELPPHIYALGAHSYSSLQQSGQSQCVIISGETGAGKTESTKLLIKFLASLSEKSSVSEQIIQANPIIEAFGNAKTTKNDNSSRFGKYVEIYFTRSGLMEGASIHHYLLEKSRIKGQNFGDRNYHVFYSMLGGISEQEKASLGLGTGKHYAYLKNGSILKCEGRDEKEEFLNLKQAMVTLNFSKDEIWDIFKLLATILHLGNLTYQTVEIDNIDASEVVECDNLNKAILMFGVSKQDFLEALTHKTIFVAGNKVISTVSKEQASFNRDGFSMALYDHIFCHIMKQINKTISHQINAGRSYIGILDIFGFENFPVNSFEQLCINFANEHLQQFFVQHIFKLEQDEYIKEGIEWRSLEFTDNADLVELIGGKQLNILTLIDEQTKFPKGDDKGFLVKSNQMYSKHAAYICSKSEMNLEFGIKHYAGNVIYKVEGFIEKNRNIVSSDWLDVISNSSNEFLKGLFTKELSMSAKPNKSSSLVIQYKISLEMLMAALNSCQPFFIRCIKPNHHKKPSNFNHQLCCQQLAYLGIMETANIRRAGYPIRHSYLQFVQDYSILLLKCSTKGDIMSKDTKTIAKSICQKVLGHKDYQLGITKVFLKASHSNALESAKMKILTNSAITLQKIAKGFIYRKRYNKLRSAAVTLQKHWRGRKPRRDYLVLKVAYMRLQSSIRSRQCTNKFKTLKKSVTQFQARCRGFLVREMGLRKMPPEPVGGSGKDGGIDIWITNIFQDAVETPVSLRENTKVLPMDSPREVNVQEAIRGDALSFKQYAAANFTTKDGSDFSPKVLDQPLLDLPTQIDQLGAIALSITILRFMGDAQEPEGNLKETASKSVMSQLNETISKNSELSAKYLKAMKELEEEESKRKSSQLVEGPKKLMNLTLIHRNKLGNELRRVQLEGEALKNSYNDWLWNKKSSVLEKLQFIIGHGILRPELRDEIYCQLCKQLSENPGQSSNINGWILMSLCAGCFPPSNKLAPTLLNFMAVNNNKLNCLSKLQRTLLNGIRNQPPSHFELNALLKQNAMVLDIHLIDDTRVISIEVDAASTASEICSQIFSHINLKDSFGFSLFISFQSKIISLEAGSCHVMDAICQCEQHAKENGIPESNAPWKFLFRKEMFAPWQGLQSQYDPVGSHLIYYQIMEGVCNGQYQCYNEKEFAMLMAQHYYITYGKKMLPEVLTELIHESIPDPMVKKKTLAYWGQLISDLFGKSHFYKCKSRDESVKLDVIEFAKQKWSLYLSKYYEVTQISGLRLDLASLLLAVNSEGIYLAKNTAEIIMKFSFPEIIAIAANKDETTGQNDRLKLTVSQGHKFVFKTDFAEVISALVNWILEELKKYSKYAMAIDDYVPPDDSFLSLAQGDLIKLVGTLDTNAEWLRGLKIKTGDMGEFPSRTVSILPVVQKPPKYILENYVNSFRKTNKSTVNKALLDLRKHTLENYANSNLRNEQKVVGRQSWMSFGNQSNKEAIWKHSKLPIHLPLHPQLQRNPFSGLATSMFAAILNYTGDKRSDKNQHTRPIFDTPLSNEPLRDELYCQLMKQVTDNANPESETKGWELLWLAAGLFPCSNHLLEDLRLFLRTRPKVICQETLDRLEKTLDEGPRKYLHHWIEVDAVQKSLPITHTIKFPNGMEKVFQVESSTRVGELVENISVWLGLIDNIGFSLIVNMDKNSISLTNNEFLFDAIQEACFNCSSNTQHMSRGETPNYVYDLVFVKKLWVNTIPGEDKIADTVCHYYQELTKYLSGFHSSTPSEQIELASLILLSEDEDNDQMNTNLDKVVENRLNSLLPLQVVERGKNYDWVRRIRQAYKKKEGMTCEEAKIAFLRCIEQWPTFGTAFFDVQELGQPMKPTTQNDFVLGINRNGILIINPTTEDVLKALSYKELLSCSSTKESFTVVLENGKFAWFTSVGHKIEDLVNSYHLVYNDLMSYYR